MVTEFDTAIIGLGLTGYSCLQFLRDRGIPVVVTDSREHPPFLSQTQQHYPDTPIYCGTFSIDAALSAKRIMLSQGIPNDDPFIQQIMASTTPIVSDIEIFANFTQQPIIGITGSNGKSTVTSLLAAMAVACDCNVGVGGNLGPPALDLLRHPEPECYILEISNFQLETTYSLAANVACILNISPDHLDRYPSYQDYINAKQQIYENCSTAVVNRDDPNTWPQQSAVENIVSFGLDAPAMGMFGIREYQGEMFLAYGEQRLMPTSELAMPGKLNWQNSLAALAIGHAYGWPLSAMLPVLREFKGLAHRCQLIRDIGGVQYINDSKGTNVGASLAALQSIGPARNGSIIWLAGGDGKGADFSELAPVVKQYVKHAILFGRDANQLANFLDPETQFEFVTDLAAAVHQAAQLSKSGDAVLLSPACASFDMFKNFQQRGEIFTSLVEELPQ